MKDIVPCELPPPSHCYLCLKLSAETFLRLIEEGGKKKQPTTAHTMGRSEEITGLVDFLKLSPLFSDKAPARHKRGRLLVQEPGHLGGSPRPHQDSLKIKPGAAAAGRGRSAGALFFFICLLQSRQPVTRQPRCVETFFVRAQL